MDRVRRFDSHRVARSLNQKTDSGLRERQQPSLFSDATARGEVRLDSFSKGCVVRSGRRVVSLESSEDRSSLATGHSQLREDRLDDLAGDVGEAEVAALEAIDQAPVVDAEEGEDGGVQVVDVDDLLDRGVAELVGGTVVDAALDPPACQPDREPL